jgi:hypothetical protein
LNPKKYLLSETKKTKLTILNVNVKSKGTHL